MFPHLFLHRSCNADDEVSSNSRDHERDEQDQLDEEDERDDNSEGLDPSVDDAEESNIKFLQAIIDCFQRVLSSAAEVINIAGVAVNSYMNTYYDK